jgi:hypothetical protein
MVKREWHDKRTMIHSNFSRNQMLDKNLFMKERLEDLLTSLEFTSGESVGKFTGLSDSWFPTQ